MAHVIEYQTEKGPVYIEVSPTGESRSAVKKASSVHERAKDYIDKASSTFESAIDNAIIASNAFIGSISQLAEQPQEVNVEFGMKISGDLKIFLISANAEANFVVKMKWSRNGFSAPK